MKQQLLFPLLLLTIACKNSDSYSKATFAAGFRTVHITDSTRNYKPGTDSTDYLHFRPIDIDIWYPVFPSEKDTTLLFRDLLGLLENRANYYTASTAGNGITGQVAQFLCTQLKCSDSTRLLGFRTQTFKNLPQAKGSFPLVVYLASYNGMSFENFAFFEALSQKGFVVAVVSSIGRFPGDMTMKKADLMEQVQDALATVSYLKRLPDIDTRRIGIVGYSWGGLAGTILTSQLPEAACLVSLDGSEYHHYGKAKDENLDFDSIRYSPLFAQMKLPVPYLRLESAPDYSGEKTDSIYRFEEKLAKNMFLYVVDSSKHEDFGCLPQTVRATGNCPPTTYYPQITNLAIRYLESILKSTSFSEAVKEAMDKKEIRVK